MTAHDKPQPAAAQGDLDPNALAAIRDLLADEGQPSASVAPAPEAAAPVAAPHEPQPRVAQAAQPAAPAHGRLMPDVPAEEPLEATSFIGGYLERAKRKVTGYRPTPKHIIWGALALLVFFRPWLVFGLLFLFAFILTGVFLIVGYDGFWRGVMGIARWYAGKHPSRSAEVHRKLDNFAMKFDAFLDRFPEGTVDGLYLPDFGDLAAAEAQHDEVLDRRFDSLRERGA